MPFRLIIQKYFIGFSYGISFPLTIVLLDYWLKDCGVTNTAIGIFSILHLPFALKLFLAPTVDECSIPILSKIFGRRRSWVIVSQLSLSIGTICISQTHPQDGLAWTMFFASFIALADGIQNIALYPYQISAIKQDQFGYTAGIVSFGHRIGGIATKCITLYCAQFWGWKVAYQCSSLLIIACMIAVMCVPQPADSSEDPKKISEKVSKENSERISKEVSEEISTEMSDQFKPFHHESLLRKSSVFNKIFEEIRRFLGSKSGMCTLLVVLLYKASDFFIQKMSRVFCLEIGFTKIEIANIVQFWGSISVVFGGFLGGYIINKRGILRAMITLSFFHMSILFMYLLLNAVGNNIYILSLLIFFEGISGGAVSASFIAFLYDKCRNGSQYALLWAIHEIGGMILRMFSGFLTDACGWKVFFFVTPLLSIPGIITLKIMLREKTDP